MIDNITHIVRDAFEINTELSADEYEDIPLSDLPIDSLGFINFIVDLEDRLSITLPEEYLAINELPDLITFTQMVENIFILQNK